MAVPQCNRRLHGHAGFMNELTKLAMDHWRPHWLTGRSIWAYDCFCPTHLSTTKNKENVHKIVATNTKKNILHASTVACPWLFRVLKTIGIEVSVFGEKEDVMFFVRHVEHIIQMRNENKHLNVSVFYFI
jgi:hypothetical protein